MWENKKRQKDEKNNMFNVQRLADIVTHFVKTLHYSQNQEKLLKFKK